MCYNYSVPKPEGVILISMPYSITAFNYFLPLPSYSELVLNTHVAPIWKN